MGITVGHETSGSALGSSAYTIGQGQRAERLKDKAQKAAEVRRSQQLQAAQIALNAQARNKQLAQNQQQMELNAQLRETQLAQSQQQIDQRQENYENLPGRQLQQALQAQKMLRENDEYAYNKEQERALEESQAQIARVNQSVAVGDYTPEQGEEYINQIQARINGIVPVKKKKEATATQTAESLKIFDANNNYTGTYMGPDGKILEDPQFKALQKQKTEQIKQEAETAKRATDIFFKLAEVGDGTIEENWKKAQEMAGIKEKPIQFTQEDIQSAEQFATETGMPLEDVERLAQRITPEIYKAAKEQQASMAEVLQKLQAKLPINPTVPQPKAEPLPTKDTWGGLSAEEQKKIIKIWKDEEKARQRPNTVSGFGAVPSRQPSTKYKPQSTFDFIGEMVKNPEILRGYIKRADVELKEPQDWNELSNAQKQLILKTYNNNLKPGEKMMTMDRLGAILRAEPELIKEYLSEVK